MVAPVQAQLLERAAEEARRRSHPEVQLAHLALAALHTTPVIRDLVQRGISSALFGDRLEETLRPHATTIGYRGGGHAPTLAPELHALVLRHSGFLSALRGGQEDALLRALLAEPPIAKLLRTSQFDAGPIRDLHLEATRTMTRLRHSSLIVPHALIALTSDARFVAALAAIEREPVTVGNMLAELMTPTYRSAPLATPEHWVRMSVTRANLAGKRSLTTEFVVVELLRSEHAVTALTSVEVDASLLLHAYVHGTAPAELPAADTLDVVLHDDDFSTMEIVVRVLTEHFGFGEDDARETMLDIHRNGRATIATLPRAEAADRVLAARATTSEHGMPLRIEGIISSRT